MYDACMTRSKAPDAYITPVSTFNMSESPTVLTCWTQVNGAQPKDSERSKVSSYCPQICA